jgi:hypothetical protein
MKLKWLRRAPGLYIGYKTKPWGENHIFDVWQDSKNHWWWLEERATKRSWYCQTLKLCKELAERLIGVENPQR